MRTHPINMSPLQDSFRSLEWGTADGKNIPIKDLTIGHLVNILNWIEDNPDMYPKSVRILLDMEAAYRQRVNAPNNEAFPMLDITHRWVVFLPTTGEKTIEPPPNDYMEAVIAIANSLPVGSELGDLYRQASNTTH